MFLPALAACAESHGVAPLVPQQPVIVTAGLGFSAVFELPAQVTRNVPFQVTYATFGSSSCSVHEPPDTAFDGTRILIIPRLRGMPAGSACTDDLATNRHTITLTWSTPSDSARFVLRGYKADGVVIEISRATALR